MDVPAMSGSARKDGNTAILMRYVLDEIERAEPYSYCSSMRVLTVSPCLIKETS